MNHTIFKFEKLFIFFCILSIFTINNIATLYEIVNREQSSYSRVIQNINLNPDSTEQLKYVDSSCETTILEFFQNKQKISAIKNLKVTTEYYNEITGNPLCHYRIIKSNSNNTIVSGENNGFSTGIGIFEDFENIKRAISFNLLIFLIGSCYQKNKERTQRAIYSKNIITVNLLTLVYSLFVGYLLTRSFTYFITSIFIPIIIQTNLFNLVFNHFKKEELLKTIFTTMFLPLLFFHSAISFYISLGIVLLANNFRKTHLFKKTIIFSFPLLFSLVLNFKNYNFFTTTSYDYSILLQSGFFQNTIVNLNDGFKTILLNLNFIILIYTFITISNYIKNITTESFDEYLKTPIIGFLIWSFINLIINYSEFFKFFIVNFLGLSKFVNTEFKFTWSGFNVGYEMTSFWFLVLLLISTYFIFKNNFYYFVPFLLLIYFSNLNGSRTAFIMYILFLPLLGIVMKGKKVIPYLFIILSMFITYNIFVPQTIERVVNKTFNSNCEASLEKFIQESDDRIGRSFDLSSYNLTFEDVLIEKTNFGNFSRKVLVKSSCVLGRQVEWARFFIISDVASENNYFGKGFGQSYEILVDDIQKPHSLILTTFYMLGKFGLGYLTILLMLCLFKKIRKRKNYIEDFQIILLLMFILNSFKTEFIFTYWGSIFTLFLFSLISVKIEE